MSRKDILVVELNEFNVDLMTAALEQNDFPFLRKVFAFPKASYRTQDRYNSGYLEPWVQWVSVHCGVPSYVHGLKHLGDVPDLGVEQCWETLSRHGITTGVWGVMNGNRRNAKNTLFFLPDPWTFSEWSTPEELNHLLLLPRYLSKNYQNLNYFTIAKHALELFRFIFKTKMFKPLLRELIAIRPLLKQFGFQHFIFISCFDYLSTLLFIQYKKTYQPKCSFLFLNSFAHLLHHHWREGTETATPEILVGLKYLDRLFEQLFLAFPQDAFVVHNALSQMNTNHEKPWVLYRQKDPTQFLKAMKIPFKKVEQHMTHDGHVFFNSQEDRDNTYQILRNATLLEKSLFHVEKNQHDPCKLFYMLAFTDDLSLNDPAAFKLNQQEYRFLNYFDKIVTRTGRHIPIGSVYSNEIHFPNHIQNHDFNRYIFNYLLPDQYKVEAPVKHSLEVEEDYFA